MYGVRAGNRMTWCTSGHLWSVKLSPASASSWCVYLMRLGDWWRVGKSKLLSTWGFGVKHRLKTEGGEEAWILSVHSSNLDATIAEQLVLANYGIRRRSSWISARKAITSSRRAASCLAPANSASSFSASRPTKKVASVAVT